MSSYMARWLLLVAIGLPAAAWGEELSLGLGTITTSVSFGDQPVTLAASGLITGRPNSLQDIFLLRLIVDMSSLQEHMTAILKSQLDTADRCGDRLSVVNAALQPAEPAGALTATIHYERWVCVKMLGKEVNKKLLGGDGQLPVNLTPSVEANEVKLTAQMGAIQAKGALGEVLRSAPVRDRLRESVEKSIESALQGGVNLKTILPPALGRVASLVSARFTDAGSGHLNFEVRADLRMPAAEIRAALKH